MCNEEVSSYHEFKLFSVKLFKVQVKTYLLYVGLENPCRKGEHWCVWSGKSDACTHVRLWSYQFSTCFEGNTHTHTKFTSNLLPVQYCIYIIHTHMPCTFVLHASYCFHACMHCLRPFGLFVGLVQGKIKENTH